MIHFSCTKKNMFHLGFLKLSLRANFQHCSDTFDHSRSRSSHQRCSIKKSVLKNFTKFTGKHLCQSLFFNKVAGLSPSTLLKKRLAQVFSCEFCEFSKNTFFTEHLWWLLLSLCYSHDHSHASFSENIYLFKVNSRNTRIRCELC